MLRLNDVTLFSIDCFNPKATLRAIEQSTRWVKFFEVILLTDMEKFGDLPKTVGYKVPVRYIQHKQGTQRLNIAGMAHFPIDYEMAAMREPALHVTTSHYLRVEWDSAVLNPDAWRGEWLSYDYIGAPWREHEEPGYPVCDGETNAVGNAGFSLQSFTYARAVRRATEEFKDDKTMPCSDAWPCRTVREWLEGVCHIRFAPVSVASRFSCENKIYSGQFAFHGQHTVAMNRWGTPFFESIVSKPK